METRLSGGCSCGKIRYEAYGKPKHSLICQCRQCQKITGTGHSPQMAFDTKSIKFSGDLKYFDTIANDGNTVSHGFCPTCGNPILNKPAAFPDSVYILIGSLDNPGEFKPEFVVFSTSGYDWDNIDPNLKRY